MTVSVVADREISREHAQWHVFHCLAVISHMDTHTCRPLFNLISSMTVDFIECALKFRVTDLFKRELQELKHAVTDGLSR